MAENLPLIPRKGAVCADVRPVLREVFREKDYLPPLATDKNLLVPIVPGEDGDQLLPKPGEWIDKYSYKCEEISERENKLKYEHARRVSKEPLPNIYQLAAPASVSDVSGWRVRDGIIRRRHLMPTIQQDAGRDGSLWVQNILNRSSCDVSCMELRGSRLHLPLNLPSADELTVQSLSIGEVVIRPPPPPAHLAPPPPLPEYIVCVPPQLDFINFTVGHLHTQTIRLVNVSKFEVRLSVSPPSRRELDVMLCGLRGLTVSSGATAEMRVRFTPRDVRALQDALRVRVSSGKALLVPIHCYMQPPILELLVPNVAWSSLSCSTGDACPLGGSDVLEMGARLLGDVHCARLLMHCEAEHAAFFVLTEDAWVSFCLDTLTRDGAVLSGPFTFSPAWWSGGGSVRGGAWCRAPHAGLHVAALRILASTAVSRPLHILADALHFTPDHITLEAQDKDYDICSEDDPACQYYVHLGTAFPNRSLSAAIQLINHSPIVYTYYWSARAWGSCSCWEDELAGEDPPLPGEDSERLCLGALHAKEQLENKESAHAQTVASARMTRVEPTRGRVAPRSTCTLHVCVPDVGARLGTQRAVLMLILKDIPKESFPPDYDPCIVRTETVISEPMPGHEAWAREVCEVVCCQLEVWWEVVPVRFVLDPPILPLHHSRRVKDVELVVRATQLFGCDGVRGAWCVPARVTAHEHTPRLTPAHSTPARLAVPLPVLPNEHPETDVFVLEAENCEWQSESTVIRQCATRHPRLEPARAWLGVVPPGAHMTSQLYLINDTYQHICWWGTPFRWYGENEPSPWCADKQVCDHCQERACTCSLLRPARGALPHMTAAHLLYEVNAPETDGCVATLVRARRTLGDVARVPSGAGCEARASLVAYRVLAPRLHLRALPCHGEGCNLDPGARHSGGTAVLRPSAALSLSRCTCYRLRFTNITPLPTTVYWQRPIDKEDILKVTFIPNDFDVGSYAQVEIRLVIEARKVCRRRLFVYCARVASAYKPIYLLIDASVAGLEVTCEIPIGGEQFTSAKVIMKRSQREVLPDDEVPAKPLTPADIFEQEDIKRAARVDNRCHCKFKMVYIPPVKPLRPPLAEDEVPEIEILWTPPPLTRVCVCDKCTKPILPDFPEPFCLQFKKIPLKTVRSRTVTVTNLSVLAGHWSASVRNWPRKRNRTLVNDAWSVDVRDPGICVEVSPPGGVLGPRARLDVTVSVYADCWGLYKDQILIHIENLEPIVVDLWVEVVGHSLHFAMSPRDEENIPTLWMSSSDPERVVRLKNTSRTDLIVHAFVLHEHVLPQDVMPFRMYLRFFDVLPRFCPCVSAFDSELIGEGSASGSESGGTASEPGGEASEPGGAASVPEGVASKPGGAASKQGGAASEPESNVLSEDMDTGAEVFFTSDYGVQEDTCFKVEPTVLTAAAGAWTELRVTLTPPEHAEVARDAVVLLRARPAVCAGPGWYRREQAPQRLRLRQTQREGVLRASARRLRVRYCALALPRGDVMRIRKSIRIQNIGNGPVCVTAATRDNWRILVDGSVDHQCGARCGCVRPLADRVDTIPLYLMPRSSTEMIVEVCISTAEAWPADAELGACSPPKYDEWKRTATPLSFFDDDNVLLTVPLILELEFPLLRVEPAAIDFDFVTDGDNRKSYFTVTHSSRTETLELVTEWSGDEEFRLWPPRLRLPPGGCERVYVQYCAKWRGRPAEGCARVAVGGGGARAWCAAAVAVRAAPARDHKCRAAAHDHTDDPALLPQQLSFM